MALIDSFPGASGTVDSTELRKNLAGLIVRDTEGVPRSGIFPRHTLGLVGPQTDMALYIRPFEGVSVRGGGPLFMANYGSVSSPTLPIPAANSQISVLYFKQNESVTPYGDANNLPIFGVETGTAAASPTKPSIAGIAGAVELATITIPSTATATNSSGVVITQTFQYTAVSGGVAYFRTASALLSASDLPEGQMAYAWDEKRVRVRNGTGWPIYAEAKLFGSVERVDSNVGVVGSTLIVSNGIAYLTVMMQRPGGITSGQILGYASIFPASVTVAGGAYSESTGVVGTVTVDSLGAIRFIGTSPGTRVNGGIFWAI